jgi:hypothetical protein
MFIRDSNILWFAIRRRGVGGVVPGTIAGNPYTMLDEDFHEKAHFVKSTWRPSWSNPTASALRAMLPFAVNTL